MGETEELTGRMDDGGLNEAEYVAVLRDLEPAGTAELADHFGTTQDKARRRLERLHEGDAPVERKTIGGSHVWFTDEAELDADATEVAEEVRRRMGVD